ncbi:MAG: phage tail protein [Chloroflexi bacterium]|nr:phage tail protein [Chloroflexota bacterium]
MTTQFVVNTHRFDPYKNFKFRIRWDGKVVAGVSKVSALKKSTEPVEHREGGDPSTPRISPSTWKYEPITLERGLTHDPEFEAWANLVHTTEGDGAISLKNFRKDMIIELLNEQGQVAKAYKIYRCWISEYTALPELDANGNAIAIESMTVQNEGWERDTSVTEPTES